MNSTIRVGDRLSYDGSLCTVRYIGEVAGTSGSWLGVEWDDPSRGKHDGRYKGHRYFSCRARSATAASFVRPTRRPDPPRDFLAALHDKYASDTQQERHGAAGPDRPVVISGKVAEEVGFDKIRQKMSQLGELKIVILDGMQISFVYPQEKQINAQESIRDVCPKVVELDLSRNLFVGVEDVVEICRELDHLQSLKINGNRFDAVHDDDLQGADKSLGGVKELSLDETLLEWPDLCLIASKFPDLASLSTSSNMLSSLPPTAPMSMLSSTVTSLSLEFNDFTSLIDIAPLTGLTALRNLHLKGNNISSILSPSSQASDQAPPVFATTLHYLDLSYNRVSTWSFADALPASFPGLTSLRFAHNPIYDEPELDASSASSALPPSTTTTANPAPTTDESYMLLVARLPTLRALNFSTISAADRTNAEMFYLSRIARSLGSAATPAAAAAAAVLARHRRWDELCTLYGEPAIPRSAAGREVDGSVLEGRLVDVRFHLVDGGEERERTVRVPKSVDLYGVKGVAGRLFGLPPLGLRLVWETGEWDPVAGFDEDGGEDSSEGEELEMEAERKGDEVDGSARSGLEGKAGRWVRREVELRDGPRPLGYCVDGLEATIRVERR